MTASSSLSLSAEYMSDILNKQETIFENYLGKSKMVCFFGFFDHFHSHFDVIFLLIVCVCHYHHIMLLWSHSQVSKGDSAHEP